MKKKLNFELLAKELDARAFTELLDNNNIDFGWVEVDDISNPNDGTYHIELQGNAYIFMDGQLDGIYEA
jgi:hypothetical protein